METLERFLSVGSGDGYGDGSGYGYGYGYGDGSGSGSGYGYGDGSGYGYGYGDGSGYGDGYGYGDGDGDDYGIKSINGNTIHDIDNVQTVIYSVHRNIARGAILNKDLTLAPCYVAKVDYCFSHGKTIKEAITDATNKAMQKKPIEERIESFIVQFKIGKHPAKDYMEWHGMLTGSCRMGRESFVKNLGMTETDLLTLSDFIRLTKNAYGSEIIKQIEKQVNPQP
jgi:hypothetical protein